MRIYITGANGFIGKNLARSLSRKFIVRGSQRSKFLSESDEPFSVFSTPNFDLVLNDIINFKPDVVIHTICCFGRKNETISQIYEVNFQLGIRLLECLSKLEKPINFINLNTSLPKHMNYYSLSKNQFSEFGRVFTNKLNHIKFLNLVVFQAFGPDQDYTKFVNYLLAALVRHKKTISMTSGKQVRDFIYIDDLVEAIEHVLRHILEINDTRDIHIGSGNGITVRSFAEMAKHIANSESELLFGDIADRDDEPPQMIADMTNLSLLGWTQKFDLCQALQETLSAIRNDNVETGQLFK